MALIPITEVDATDNSYINITPSNTVDNTTNIRTLLNAVRNRGYNGIQGGTVYFPAGVYLLNQNVFSAYDVNSPTTYRGTGLTIRGDGPGATIFRFKNNMATGVYAFDLSGASSTNLATGFSMNNVTLSGDNQIGHWFRMNNANQILLDRVYFSYTNGFGIDATDWTDSNLHDCRFFEIGKASTAEAALKLRAGCKNVRIQAVSWEKGRYRSCDIGASSGTNVESIRFTCCHWDGDSAVSQAQVYAQYAKELNFRGCRFFNSGSDAIRGDNCTGMVVTGGSCDDAAGYAVNLTNSTNCIVLGNNFAGGANPTPPLNNGGNGNVTGATIYKRNAVLPTDGTQST